MRDPGHLSVSSSPPRRASRRRFLLLTILVLLPSLPRYASASCPCKGEDVEIAILLDCSGSMNHMLATLQEQARYLLEAMQAQARNQRAAAIVFRTREYAGRQLKLEVLPFTSDTKRVSSFLRSQRAEGGGHEMVKEALEAALKKLQWGKGARKVAILLGDEQPKADQQEACLRLAKALKDRGIVLHTVTASQTAWIYWAPLNKLSWKQQLTDMGKEAKRVFRLPHFDALAEAGSGISVSSWNSRELILWMLAFGLGLNERQVQKRVDVSAFLAWSKEREIEERERKDSRKPPRGKEGTPLIAWLKHGGEWQVPHDFGKLLQHLNTRVSLSGPQRVRTIGLLDPDLARHPVLYVTGHGPIKWSNTERDLLRNRLLSGGLLFSDACCGDERFDRSFRAAIKAMFPKRELTLLAPSHAIYTAGHDVKSVMRSDRTRTGKLKRRDAELLGLSLPDPVTQKPRLAVVYSPHDLGCSWHHQLLGVPCMHSDEDGTAIAANIIVWALTR